SGSGKSTLLKLIAGLLTPMSGSVSLEGEPIRRECARVSRLLSTKISMSFQKGGLLDCFNAWENIDFALKELTPFRASERKEIAFHALEQVGLLKAKENKLRELSGGMLKRLSLARTFALRPKLLLLDDPTAGLDPVTAEEIVSLIQSFCEANRCLVVFTSSDLAVSFKLASQLVFLWDGTLSKLHTVQEFKKSNDPAIEQFTQGSLTGPLTQTVYA
ncbi:MAG: ABC transporter ATP-binding protein, partial [Pseudomonadota bacterium]